MSKRFLKASIALFSVAFAPFSANANVGTSNVTIETISIWNTGIGGIAIHTSPSFSSHNGCNNYWAYFNMGGGAANEEMLSTLLTAKATGSKVYVEVEDPGSTGICTLIRVVY